VTPSAYDRVCARLLERTGAAGRNGTWRCPAHDDSTPSLSVTRGNYGKVLVHCHANCAVEDVLAALDLKSGDLFDTARTNGSSDITATYDYVDEDGRLLFQVVRKPNKRFVQRRPDSAGGWVWKLGNTRRVLYRLPELIAGVADGSTVFVVEGEKDADRLAADGYVATCNPHGAGKWRPEFNAAFAGADVVIVADRDDGGRKHARHVHQQLIGVATKVRVVEAAEGKDVSDHLAAGRTVEDLVLADVSTTTQAQPLSALPQPSGVTSARDAPWRAALVDWATFWGRERVEAEWLVEPFVARGRAHALAAPAKSGKSLLTLDVLAALATGRSVLAQPAGAPVDVVYVDFEMAEADLYERLTDLGYGPDDDLSHLHYFLMPTMPALDTDDGGRVAEQMAGDYHAALLAVDTIGRALTGPENDADTFLAFHRYTGTRLKRLGVAAMRLDHYGKAGDRGQRGSSAKNDDVDIVWELTPGDGGSVRLRATHKRMVWVPERVPLQRGGDPLRHRLVEDTWPTGTMDAVDALNKLDAPLDIGRPAARDLLRAHELRAGNEALAAALRYRRTRSAGGR
jgi:AAA domain